MKIIILLNLAQLIFVALVVGMLVELGIVAWGVPLLMTLMLVADAAVQSTKDSRQ